MNDDIIKSFNKTALFEDKWDHNRRYSKLLLKKIDLCPDSALYLCCGTGEFTGKLSGTAKQVKCVDVAPQMIEEAEKRHSAENIEYVLQDLGDMDENVQHDCAASIAALHHISLDDALPKIKRILKPGEILLALDLYERIGMMDLLLDIIAIPADFIMKLIMNRSSKTNKKEVETWNEHHLHDKYITLKNLKETYKKYFGDDVKIRRLVFWIYPAVYWEI